MNAVVSGTDLFTALLAGASGRELVGVYTFVAINTRALPPHRRALAPSGRAGLGGWVSENYVFKSFRIDLTLNLPELLRMGR